MLSSPLICADARVTGRGRSIGEHEKEETLTGYNGMREIDRFVIDVVGSETGDIGGKNVH